jgi:hypothetical protein
VSEVQTIEFSEVEPEIVALSLEWEQLMQAAVARALDEHRRFGHSIAVMRDNKVVVLSPTQY